jgi:hypothetical protein
MPKASLNASILTLAETRSRADYIDYKIHIYMRLLIQNIKMLVIRLSEGFIHVWYIYLVSVLEDYIPSYQYF